MTAVSCTRCGAIGSCECLSGIGGLHVHRIYTDNSAVIANLQSDNDRLRAEVVELLWDIVNEQAFVNADGSIYSGYKSTVAGAMLRLGELGLLKITRHEGRGVDAELIKEQP